MIFARKAVTLLLLSSGLLTACGSSVATSTPVDADTISTSLVGTLVAGVFQTQTAVAPAPLASYSATPSPQGIVVLPTPLSPSPTFYYFTNTPGTPLPSLTPRVTGTIFTPTIDPNSLAFGCNNLAFVRDVTIPAGTVMKPGEDFGKTWKVANIGTCDWLNQYSIVLVSGDAMSGKATKLARVVTVGHWAELTVQMGAPKSPGIHTAYWRLADADGHMFGSSLAVSINVNGNPTETTAPPTDTTVPSDTPDASATP